MKFIEKIGSYSSETIYDYQHIRICKFHNRTKRVFVVKIFDLEFFVQAEEEMSAYNILDFVVKNNPNSGEWLLCTIIGKAFCTGKENGRKEMQDQIQKLMGL